ncbi:MAG TPA: indolepyruvate ferredoxin oxidoreductase family protein [Burkholderiaceae bacterium]|nr:indolepyruvate ferredoxin oxidoreductase family protein [Burkholderiaceae bacterium]
MNLRDVALEDRWRIDAEPVLLSGPQALVRLLLSQRELDRRAGLKTGGFVSGYRGSPLGGLDTTLWKARPALEAAGIEFVPGVNEDLAATAVWGTQQLRIVADPTVEGVFAMWYGKGPGVDRSGDPIKHGNYTGTHPNGGVLAVFGDDHPGKSSTIAHHSEQAMAAHSVPVVYPSDVGEFVRFGLLGWAMSRYSGCWTAMKVVNETVEQTATTAFDLDALRIERPDASDLSPAEGVHFRGVFAPLQDESILVRARLPRVHRFARANGLDRVSLGADARFGIVTAGKAHQDTMQALRYLGIDEARARELGVAVYKVGLIWPLEPQGLREFAAGKLELMFVEEKAAFTEPQAAAILYNDAARPRIVGKHDEAGRALLPQESLLEPIDVAIAIAERLRANGLADAALEARVAATRSYRSALLAVASPGVKRLPFFCSGCPHNTSTNVPDGSLALSGIGCHGMALWAKPGTTALGTQMGGEGLSWVGLSRFTRTPHVFQNLGDGTYFHSGLLAIRAAVASGANITYKILFNDAVAMTGGQPIDGPISPARIAHQVVHEGVARLVLVSDDPSRHEGGPALPAGTRVVHRDALDAVQRELREVPGCTVILYEQTCAAEKRRRRKRGRFADPDRRMFIHAGVCEGCGDCSTQSSCTSLQPVETPMGRKRRVDQSTCNKDFSCTKGFCPSFVSVSGVRPKRPRAVSLDGMPSPPRPDVAPLPADGFGVMIAGIGGTGVITVGAVLAMAAHLERHAASAYDMTGLSQKNGAVYSHLRIAPQGSTIASQRLGLGEASVVLAFDMVAALGDESHRTLDGARSRFLGNERVQPTAALNFDPDDRVDTGLLARRVREKLGEDRVRWVDASGLATALCGDAMATNLFMVGTASQLGWLPVGPEAIERAVELNGVQVEMNRLAFALGRLWVHDRARVEAMLERPLAAVGPRPEPALDELVAHRVAHLTAWQDARWARRYAAAVERVRVAERAAVPDGDDALARAAARNLAKLMSYKDEYEVARLYADPSFVESLRAEFDGTPRLTFNLAPPLFARRDPRTGRPEKREYGAWMLPVFRLLAPLRRLRGTALDPFGRTAERRMERELIGRYERDLEALLERLTPANHALAVEIASLPDAIRGYGPVKEASAARARARRDALWARWNGDARPEAPSPRVARAA